MAYSWKQLPTEEMGCEFYTFDDDNADSDPDDGAEANIMQVWKTEGKYVLEVFEAGDGVNAETVFGNSVGELKVIAEVMLALDGVPLRGE